MIRINLLPIKQDRRREALRHQILLAIGVVAAELAVLVAINLDIAADIDTQRNLNSSVQAEVSRIQNQIKDHETILNEIKEFELRQAAIEGLQDARTGPVYVMLELSNILSKSGRPNIDNAKYQELLRIDPAAGYDEDWDYRRLWLLDFSEREKEITIRGEAMTHEDVAEFLRRINLSLFFVSSELNSTVLGSPQTKFARLSPKEIEPVVKFEIKGKVRYR